MTDLKNCPFCGAKPFVTRDCGFEIGCSTVDCSNYMVERGNWDLASTAWNRRAPPTAVLNLMNVARSSIDWLAFEGNASGRRIMAEKLYNALAAAEKELLPELLS